MRVYTAMVTNVIEVRDGVRVIEMHAPQLAQTAQPGQYCMVRCAPEQASDPLLRRPFFIHGIDRARGLCSLLVHVCGRGTSWLAAQREGSVLDILGPLGHGWSIRPTVGNLLLVSEGTRIAALTYLAQVAIERELAVTLVAVYEREDEAYPPALLLPEVEYHIVTRDGGTSGTGRAGNMGSTGERGGLMDALGSYLPWADAAYLALERETAETLYTHFERLRKRQFAQVALLYPLVCGTGVCLTCSLSTRSGPKLLCHDGPILDLRAL